MKVLIYGGTGMLGHMLFWYLNSKYAGKIQAYATVRSEGSGKLFPQGLRPLLLPGVDASRPDSLKEAAALVKPDLVVNAIGLIRQLPEGKQPYPCIELNARLPHLINKIAADCGARMVHYSTDCVFDGKKGSPYTDDEWATAKDVYGLTKFLGEMLEGNALTIRTSIIGHELRNGLSLVEWFMAQTGAIKGYTRAIYTGLTTCEQARILAEYVIPNSNLKGLYQVSSNPISKHDLLGMIARQYGKEIEITPDDSVNEDKRLDSGRFTQAAGYKVPTWETLVADMHASNREWHEQLKLS